MLVITFDQIVALPFLNYDTLILLKCKKSKNNRKEGDITIISATLNVHITHNFVHIIIQVLMLMDVMLFTTLFIISNVKPRSN